MLLCEYYSIMGISSEEELLTFTFVINFCVICNNSKLLISYLSSMGGATFIRLVLI